MAYDVNNTSALLKFSLEVFDFNFLNSLLVVWKLFSGNKGWLDLMFDYKSYQKTDNFHDTNWPQLNPKLVEIDGAEIFAHL